MAIFDSPEQLAAHLAAAGIECSVLDDGCIRVDSEEAEIAGTLELTGGWLIFKAFLGDWPPGAGEAALRSLLLLQDRLIGFRFSVERGDLWVLQEFPIEALNDSFRVYLDHAFVVLGTILPTLMQHLSDNRQMSDEDIDAMFGRLDAGSLQ